jgi:hypothetical protein
MASPPAGQSCATCAFYINGTCREASPQQTSPDAPRWPTVAPSEWCGQWKAVTP